MTSSICLEKYLILRNQAFVLPLVKNQNCLAFWDLLIWWCLPVKSQTIRLLGTCCMMFPCQKPSVCLFGTCWFDLCLSEAKHFWLFIVINLSLFNWSLNFLHGSNWYGLNHATLFTCKIIIGPSLKKHCSPKLVGTVELGVADAINLLYQLDREGALC
jgi:hypothetical protein